MDDDYGESYYFRGAVENNYVYFAGYYWRIIRINGDKTVRMIYDGTTAHENGDADFDRVIGPAPWNITSHKDAKFVGYMYGGANGVGSTSLESAQTNETSSNMKTVLEKWYEDNIEEDYGDNVADEIFCNDRSVTNGKGFNNNTTYYGSYTRNYTSKSPSLNCPQDNDKFTVSSDNGNGDLDKPIGLITADEIVIAGGKFYNSDGSSNNKKYYLYKGVGYWSMTPFREYNESASVFAVNTNGYLHYYDSVANEGGKVVPVINLKSFYFDQMMGDGTINNPYRAG